VSEQPSARERIRAIATQMLTGQPTPATLSQFEVSLAGLLSVVNDEVTAAELAFKRAVMDADAKSNAAKKTIAEGGPAYARLVEAKATYDTCHQMLMTCRNSVRRATEELRLQR
jgi:hypothetical protein